MYRREALGAFAHEIRTPLTSIRMVIELARRQASEGEMLLDAELAGMLDASVNDLQSLADDLQEASRLERGKIVLSRGPCELAAAIEAARELLPPSLSIAGIAPVGIEGPWDAPHLVRVIAGVADACNRAGDGGGTVRFDTSLGADGLQLCFASGEPGSDEKPIAADAGFSFFRSRQFVIAMGGTVAWERSERFMRVTVTLPMALPGGR
jgi:signal transduction histidine kinase